MLSTKICMLVIIIIIIIIIIWLHYLSKIRASPVALLYSSPSCATCLQLTIPIFLTSFSTPCLRLEFIFSYVVFGVSSFGILSWCFLHHPSYPSKRCGLIIVPMLTSIYNFSRFVLTRHWLSSVTGPKVFVNIFLSTVVCMCMVKFKFSSTPS
jgi:hypothetical protein